MVHSAVLIPSQVPSPPASSAPTGLVAKMKNRWVAVIRPGKILFEMEGVDRATAAAAMRLAAHKLPIRTKFISREDGE